MNAPFYPLRPHHGPPLTRGNVLKLFQWARKDCICQPKADGHRVIVLVDATGQAHVFNRYGGTYSWTIQNAPAFQRLPPQTILDGENFHHVFAPFDAIRIAGRDLRGEPLEARLQEVQRVCGECGLPWLFAEPGEDWLAAGVDGLLGDFEGIVAKARGSLYHPPRKPHWESIDWLKMKWGKQ